MEGTLTSQAATSSRRPPHPGEVHGDRRTARDLRDRTAPRTLRGPHTRGHSGGRARTATSSGSCSGAAGDRPGPGTRAGLTVDTLGIRVPDGIEPVTACRVWTIDPEGPTLRSLVQGTTWMPGERFSAICLGEEPAHARPPHLDRSCGVWGMANPSGLAPHAAQPTIVTG